MKSTGLPCIVMRRKLMVPFLSKGSSRSTNCLIQLPKEIWIAQMAGKVIGLVTQHDAIATGMLARALIAPSAAISICMGMGSIAQKSPTDNPLATVLVHGCQSFLSNIGLVRASSHGLFLI